MSGVRVEVERLLPALVAPFQPSQENNEVEVFGLERRSLTVLKDEVLSESKADSADASENSPLLKEEDSPAVVVTSQKALSCGICLDDIPADSTSMCGSPSCALLCSKCAESYVSDKINASMGVCVPIRCVGVNCKAIISMKKWKDLVPVAVLQKYTKSASDLLTLQCGGCHRRGTLFERGPDQIDDAKDLIRVQKATEALTAQLKRSKDHELVEELLAMLPKFSSGELVASAVVKHLESVLASSLKVSATGMTYDQVMEQLNEEKQQLSTAKATLVSFDNSPERMKLNGDLTNLKAKLRTLAVDLKSAKIAKDRAQHALRRKQLKKEIAAKLRETAVPLQAVGTTSEEVTSAGTTRRKLVFSDVEVFVPLTPREQPQQQQQRQQQQPLNEQALPSEIAIRLTSDAILSPPSSPSISSSSSSSTVAQDVSASTAVDISATVAIAPSTDVNAVVTDTTTANTTTAVIIAPSSLAASPSPSSSSSSSSSSSLTAEQLAFVSSAPPSFTPSFLPSLSSQEVKDNSGKECKEPSTSSSSSSSEAKSDSQRERKEAPPSPGEDSGSGGDEPLDATQLISKEIEETQEKYDQLRAHEVKERADLVASLQLSSRTAHIGVLQNLATELYQAPLKATEVLMQVAALFDDIERKAALQLSFFLRNPKVTTKCCTRIHCFKCKTQGFHDGKSCDEVQPVSEVKSCPGCNVSLLKGDGCSSVTCVCGHNFNWANLPSAPPPQGPPQAQGPPPAQAPPPPQALPQGPPPAQGPPPPVPQALLQGPPVPQVLLQGPPAQGPPPPVVQAPPAPDWECRACTFLNALHRTECELCLTPRPRA